MKQKGQSVVMLARMSAIAGAMACLVANTAYAAWPDDKPIEVLVGFQAGGGTDILARKIAPFVAKHLGGKANFVIMNRPGAAGEIALGALARAKPDGYTIGVLSTPSFITVQLHKKPQYDPAAIVPIARVVEDPALIVANAKSPLTNLADLVSKLKAAPASVSMGNNGIGTNGHMATLALQAASNTKLNDIPFKGTAEARTALLGGHVDTIAMSATEFAADKTAAKEFRVLAQLSPVRVPFLPDVPTASEQGFDVVISSERGFAAPRGLPPEIADRLQKAFESAVRDPEFLQNASTEALAVSYLSGPDWTKHMAEQKRKFEAIWQASPEKYQ